MTRKTSPAYRASKEETIPINKLHPFSNHPFHIRHDLEFSELVDSISESGIITPIIVRPKVGVGYCIPNTLETFQKYVCGSIESVRLDRDAYIICNDEGKLLPLPPNRLYGPTDFFAGPFLICGDGGEDLISLTDSQITKYEKKYHSPLIFLELYPKPITLKCTPELYAKCMGEEHQHDTQENEHDER